MTHVANKWVKRNTTHDTDTENSYKRRRLTDSLREAGGTEDEAAERA